MRAILLYDEACGFCRWALAKILGWDRSGVIRPATLRGQEADRLLEGMDRGRRMASWHLVTLDGHIHSGGDAIGPLARLLPAGAPVAWLAEHAPRLTRSSYGLIARNRGRLGSAFGERACRASPVARRRGSP